MVNQQVLAHHWDDVRGQLCEKWHQLKEDDLPKFPGNVDQLIGRIEQKTGATREAIEAYLSTLTEEGHEVAGKVRERVQQAASSVASTARQGTEMAKERLAEAEGIVREHPGQAIMAAFGCGLVCGMAIAMLLRGQSRPRTRIDRGRAMLNDALYRGRGVFDDAYERGRHAFDDGSSIAGRLGRQIRESISGLASHR